MLPIVVCTVTGKSLPILEASVKAYCPGVELLVFSPKRKTSGQSYTVALTEAFKTYDEVIVASDDIVLTPNSYRLLMEDVENLKSIHGDKLGFVCASSDYARDTQNIRFQQSEEYKLEYGKWTWENQCRKVNTLSPFFVWYSKKAFEAAPIMDIEWFSDDILCEDLNDLGYVHYISRSYVHHAGSQTIGENVHNLQSESIDWIARNRPETYRRLFKGEPPTMSLDKKPLKICVYTISKNEEMFVERWANSAKDADLLLIADTGSTDRTVEIAKELGIKTHEICITPWRFDHARNASIALIPRDMDVCICMDMDEVLEPGWREEIERVWTDETTRLSYFFDWGAGIKFRYEKIHARHGYFWHHPCHEYPMFDKRITEVWAHTDKLLVSHHPDPTKSRGQYMDLLQLSVDEDPDCPRNAFYYARELSFHYRWQDAIDACNKYLALPRATWPNERCYAYRIIGKCYSELGNFFESEKAFQKACSEAPNTREPWCELSLLMYRQNRWEECFAYASRALRIESRELVYTCDPAVWGHWPHDLMSIAAWHLGLKDIALKQAQLAVEKTPEDQRLINNLTWIQKAIDDEKNRVVPNIIHFMYFFGPKSREFSYINYLAVRAAYEVQNPDKIYFYYNTEPENNPHWEAIKQYVEMVQIEPPTEWQGVFLKDWPQYQADIVRLQKLYEHGGIYLDTDAILTKPLTPCFGNKCTMSGRINGVSEGAIEGNEHTSSAIIVAEPKSEFIRLWLDGVSEGLKKDIWAWHSVCLPVELYRQHPGLLTLLPEKEFLPFDFNDPSIFDLEKTEEIMPVLERAYVVHLWETIWHDVLRNIDREYLSTVDNAFTRLFKKYG